MKKTIGTAALAVLLAASPAAAQRDAAAEIEDAVRRSGVVEAVEELAVAVAPELERIAESIGRLALRVSEDPELRRSALRAALGAVEVAEVVVVEHTWILREALRDAAEELERMAERMGSRSGR
jgi:hypothetical protein